MLEAGIVGGNSVACPGRYVGINGRVAGPVSLYGMVETYRCADRAGSANRIGASVLLGRSSWLVRPALRAGIEYDGGDDVWPTAGASLTFGRRYGARFILHVGDESGGTALVRKPNPGTRPEPPPCARNLMCIGIGGCRLRPAPGSLQPCGRLRTPLRASPGIASTGPSRASSSTSWPPASRTARAYPALSAAPPLSAPLGTGDRRSQAILRPVPSPKCPRRMRGTASEPRRGGVCAWVGGGYRLRA